MTVTGDEVFEAFKTDPHVQGPNDPQLEMMEPFIKALPEVLGDSLDELLDLHLLFDAKLRFAKYCLDNGMIERAGTVMKDILGDDLEDMLSMLAGALSDLVEQMQEVAPNLGEVLAAQGVTEREVLVSDRVGLNQAMQARLEADNLTLGDLLANQPGVVIVNES